ncbi:MAG TPA: hypothetical protein VMH39_08800, partial [Gemmatimonadaceae bacterium]|nr:hypothetical protein [Gemmatimonadaceae bacterium]
DVGSGALTFRSNDDPVLVAGRLRELPPAPETPVVVSWNSTTAALTDWSLFTDRWDQFCHAAADDLTVWPMGGAWTLCYRRYEVFQFRSCSHVC